MTSALFFDWLERFACFVKKDNPQRKVALLIDNCSAHGTAETLPSIEGVHVHFLPPNSTSRLQPLDAGIIAALKVRYRSQQYEHALDRMDVNLKDIYKVDQLTAMRWVKDIWESLPSSLIFNCWCHTTLIKKPASTTESTPAGRSSATAASGPLDPEAEARALQEPLSHLLPRATCERISVANLVSPPGEADCFESVEVETLAEKAAARTVHRGEVEEDPADESEDEEHDAYLEDWTFVNKMTCVLATSDLLTHHGVMCDKAQKALRELKRVMRLSQAESRKQTRISDYFN